MMEVFYLAGAKPQLYFELSRNEGETVALDKPPRKLEAGLMQFGSRDDLGKTVELLYDPTQVEKVKRSSSPEDADWASVQVARVAIGPSIYLDIFALGKAKIQMPDGDIFFKEV
jgi:hypothetical protein